MFAPAAARAFNAATRQRKPHRPCHKALVARLGLSKCGVKRGTAILGMLPRASMCATNASNISGSRLRCSANDCPCSGSPWESGALGRDCAQLPAERPREGIGVMVCRDPYQPTAQSPVLESACDLPPAVIAALVTCDLDDRAFESFQLVTGKSWGRPARYVASLPFGVGAAPAHPFTAQVALNCLLTAPQTLPVRSGRRVYISPRLHADFLAGSLVPPGAAVDHEPGVRGDCFWLRAVKGHRGPASLATS